MSALIRKSEAPSQAEFHTAIANRADYWYAACLRITRDPELAEDAVQDALLNAWRQRRQFKGDARLETWIHRIAVNAALQSIRRQRPDRFAALQEDPADPSASPEAAQSGSEFAENLSQACEQLSEAERTCFTLKHLEDWRLQEIADELGTNVGSVKQALFRAVKKLRARLSGPHWTTP